MDDEHITQLGRWQRLLVFAAGSILTAIVSTFDHMGSLLNGMSPLIRIVLLFWILFGAATGVWIIRGQSWRPLARDVRRRLGLAYLAVGWSGLVAILMNTPWAALIIVTGIALAMVFFASLDEIRLRKQDEGDTFP